MPLLGGSRTVKGGAGGPRAVAVLPGSSAGALANVLLDIQSQANALVDPSDTPTIDTLRVVRDAAGNLAIYVYSVTQAAWKGVQVA